MERFRRRLLQLQQQRKQRKQTASEPTREDRCFTLWYSSDVDTEGAFEQDERRLDRDGAPAEKGPCARHSACLIFVPAARVSVRRGRRSTRIRVGGDGNEVDDDEAIDVDTDTPGDELVHVGPQLLLIGGVRTFSGQPREELFDDRHTNFGDDGAYLGDAWSYDVGERLWRLVASGDRILSGAGTRTDVSSDAPPQPASGQSVSSSPSSSASSSASDSTGEDDMPLTKKAVVAASKHRKKRKQHFARKRLNVMTQSSPRSDAAGAATRRPVTTTDPDDDGAAVSMKPSQPVTSSSADRAGTSQSTTRERALDALYRVARGGHTCVLFDNPVGGSEVVMFGGKSRFFLNDLWVFSLRHLRWRRVQENSSSKNECDAQNRPSARWGHTAVVLAADVHGAHDAGATATAASAIGNTKTAARTSNIGAFAQNAGIQFGETMTDADGENGTHNNSSSNNNNNDTLSTAAHSQSLMMWVFGGLDGRMGMASRSLYCLNLSTFDWLRVDAQQGATLPPARFQHSAVAWQGAMYIFGGRDEEGSILSDLWKFDTNTWVWTQISAEQPEHTQKRAPPVPTFWPSARFGHIAAVDAAGEVMCLLGGRSSYTRSEELWDVWEFNFVSCQWSVSRSPFTTADGSARSPGFAAEWPRQGLTGACIAVDPRGAADFFVLTGDGQNVGAPSSKGIASSAAAALPPRSVQLWECYPRSALADTLNHVPKELAKMIFLHLVPHASSLSYANTDHARAMARQLTHVASVCRRWREVMHSSEVSEALWRGVYNALVEQAMRCRLFPVPRDTVGTAFAEYEGANAERDRRPLPVQVAHFLHICHLRRAELRSLGLSSFALVSADAIADAARASSSKRFEQLKVTVVGAQSVGKTSSLFAYVYNDFPTEYAYYNMLDNFSGNVMIGGTVCSCSFWDTAGQEDYDRLRALAYPQTDIFLMVYAVNSPGSLAALEEKFVPEVLHHMPGTPMVFAGNKIDLVSDDLAAQQQQQNTGNTSSADQVGAPGVVVSQEEGDRVAAGCGAVAHIQFSALTQQNLKFVFDTTISVPVLNKRGELPGSSSFRRKKGRGGNCPMQ